MPQPTAKSRLALVSVATLAAVGLACNLLSSSEPTAAATATPTEPTTAAATATPTTEPTTPPATEAAVYNSGRIHVDQSYGVSFDRVELAELETQDLFFHVASETQRYIQPWNEALLAEWATGEPSYENCAGAPLARDVHYEIENLNPGDWFCFQTTEGRLGRFEIQNITSGTPQTISIDVLVWEE